jgi:two-component system, sensor histidine kinase and response regulator
VQMVAAHNYDLVLMDMQMPVMDGLAASRAIRLKPQFQSLPIIAMTANVMESDRDKCTEAGMNDHLTKPIDPQALFAALLRWVKPRGDRATGASAEAVAVTGSVPQPAGPPETTALEIAGVDTQSALRRTGGNPKRYEMLLRKFAESANVEEIRTAHASGDTATAERAAHSLKGAAANLGATVVANAAAEAETAIKTGQSVQPLLEALDAKLRAVVQAIRSVLPTEQVADTRRAATADPASVGAPLRRLTKLLSNNDGEAADFIVDAQSDLAKVLTGSEITSLQAFVGNYDFNGALKCVSEIAGRLGLQLE